MLAVQAPDPWAVFGRVQAVVEPDGVADLPAVDPRPRVRIVDHRPARGRPDARSWIQHDVAASLWRAMRRPISFVHLDVVDAHEVAAQPIDRLDQAWQVVAADPVVAVEEGEVLAGRRVKSDVACRGEPHRHLVTDRGQRHPLCVLGDDLRRAVVRAVVDDDVLEARFGIERESGEHVRQVPGDVAHRHDHGQDGFGAHAQMVAWRGDLLMSDRWMTGYEATQTTVRA